MVLSGGLARNRLYLIQGMPGTGKTTMAMHWLIDGVRRGERCLYVTLSETKQELHAAAASHDWSLDGISIYEMTSDETGVPEEDNTFYVPAEVELGERMRALLAEMDRVKPSRMVLDSCSELRLLAQTPLRFRRQILALKQEIGRRECTILLLENSSIAAADQLLQSLVHGVVVLEQLLPVYGAERRRLRIVKLRESEFRGGYHDFVIRHDGIAVFPRLVAGHRANFPQESVSSGVTEIDELLGGGIDRGTGTLIMGPAGTGKSALATQYAVCTAERGESVVWFIFDEGPATLLIRSAGMGMDIAPHLESGRIKVQPIDPTELSPGEFAKQVCDAVAAGANMVIIDSLNGYLQAMAEEQFVALQLHEVLTFLRHKGTILIMVVAQHGFPGPTVAPIDVSYLADTVILMRYFEAEGRVRKVISVTKKRSGPHEDTIREVTLTGRGIAVGPPLQQFRGVLTGTPIFDGGK